MLKLLVTPDNAEYLYAGELWHLEIQDYQIWL